MCPDLTKASAASSDRSEALPSTLRQRYPYRSAATSVTATSVTTAHPRALRTREDSTTTEVTLDCPDPMKSPPDHPLDDQKKTTTTSTKSENNVGLVWSSGVAFFPPSQRYWRIGQEWYDLDRFDHPGGRQVLELARDRFEDATFAFEAHHHDYHRARKILAKYRVSSSPPTPAPPAPPTPVLSPTSSSSSLSSASSPPSSPRPLSSEDSPSPPSTAVQIEPAVVAAAVTAVTAATATPSASLAKGESTPLLLDDDAFYSVLRQRVTRHLKEVGCPNGEPTWECVGLFALVLLGWSTSWVAMYLSGEGWLAVVTAVFGALLGAFGHNWVHQPKYKEWGWATLSLDTVGYSSENWYRNHVLQHHMYTNSPWDSHFKGTDPFLVADPTRPRGWLQGSVLPRLHPLVLAFGTYGNYTSHAVKWWRGEEVWSWAKLWFVVEHLLLAQRWGWLWGFWALGFVRHAVTANYYFTLALMNHNAEHTLNVSQRNASKDWGEAQLHTCADWATDWSFLASGFYMWLNYHTIHHLFPKVDMSHHPHMHGILVQTCQEFGLEYNVGTFWSIYTEMVQSFAQPRSLHQAMVLYVGSGNDVTSTSEENTTKKGD